jgi:signal transduction histidine kinase
MRRNPPPIIVLAWLVGLALVRPSAAVAERSPARRPLTRIVEIRALTPDEGARGYPVSIRGTVTHFDEVRGHELIIHDGAWGQFLIDPVGADTIAAWKSLRRGDVLEVEGRTVRGGFAPNVQPHRLRKIGRAPLPPAKRLPHSLLLTGRYDCDYVEVDGIVQRAWVSTDPGAHSMFAEVAMDGGLVRATFWKHGPDDLKRFIDARVRLRGNAGTLFGQTGQLRGVSIFGGHTSDIEVLSPAPDPFMLPVRAVRTIYNYSPGGEVNRRVRVRGVVTSQVLRRPVQMNDFPTSLTFSYGPHVIYLRDADSGAQIETEQDTRVRPGQVIEASGFPAVTPGKPMLRNAIFRIVGSAREPDPIPVTPSTALTAEYDTDLVRIKGELLGVLRNPTAHVLVVRMGETVFDASLEASQAAGLPDVGPGSVVTVTGVYSFQWGPPPGFRLFLRSPADVVLVSAAPWWTLRHSAVLLVIVAVVAAAAVLWARLMARRKRQEFRAILAERNRVARELHDTLEQGLAAITLQLEAVSGSIDASPPRARQSLEVARQMLRFSLEETRRSVMDLRSQALESRDLAGALTNVATQMAMGCGARVDVHVEGTSRRLDATQEHHLLRIGLEALTNALRHSGASTIEIALRFGADAIELVVRDNGCGIDRARINEPGAHFGLQGIRERVDRLGGTVRIESTRDEGTQVAVMVPLPGSTRVLTWPVLREMWRRT